MSQTEKKPTDTNLQQENAAILGMMQLLSDVGRNNFSNNLPWEKCLCALVMTLNPKTTLRQLLEALPYHERPMDEADLMNTTAHLGYFARSVKCNIREIDPRLLPCLFVSAQGVPFIILGLDSNGNQKYCDPETMMLSSFPPNGGHISGRAWFFQTYDEHRPATSKFMRQGSGKTWFRALLGRFYGTAIQVLTVGLILNLIALLTPVFIMLVYDRVIASGTIDILPMLMIGALFSIAFEANLRTIRSKALSYLAGRLDNIVGNQIFAHLIGLSPSLIEKASVTSQLARIKTFESVRDFFSGSVFLSLLEIPFVFLSILAIGFIAGPLVLVPLSMITLYILMFWYIRAKVKTTIRLAAKTSSARQQFTIETFEKIDSIRSHGLQKKWQEKFCHLSGREMVAHFRLNFLGLLAETIAHTITVIAAVATVGFGVHLIWIGSMTTGALVATMILVWRVLTPFYSLCTMIPRLEQLRNSIIQVNMLFEMETERQEAKSASRLTSIKGAISFDVVKMQYDKDGDIIFSDLSFEAPPGTLIALTGNNGTGKSTVLKLAKGLYTPTSGAIRIDGFDLRQLDATDLRRQVAYVPQTPDFFYGSIIENLRLSNPLATRLDIEKALRMADAWEDISKMPDKVETIINGHSGKNLTTSIASKLSLARVYLNPAKILLIDELPNTMLSSKTGDNLRAYIDESRDKRTIIMATYRQDFLSRANIIVMLRGTESPMVGSRETMAPHFSKGKVA